MLFLELLIYFKFECYFDGFCFLIILKLFLLIFFCFFVVECNNCNYERERLVKFGILDVLLFDCDC